MELVRRTLLLAAVVLEGRRAPSIPLATCCQSVAPKVWVAMEPRAEGTRPRGDQAVEAPAVILAVLKQLAVAKKAVVCNQRVARKPLEEP